MKKEATIKKVDKQVFFEIGCFHFGLKKNPPFEFNGKKYITELRKILNNIPNIDHLFIDDPENEFYDKSIRITEKIPSIDQGKGYFPHPIFVVISFKLKISKEKQESIMKKVFLNAVLLPTEYFYVRINYEYENPIAIIELSLNNPANLQVSDAVVIVREFLKEQFNKTNSKLIRFESLGPSPLHCDFKILPASKKLEKENFLIKPQYSAIRGYDDIYIYYNSSRFKNLTEVKNFVFYNVSTEASFFYYLASTRVFLMHEWNKIEKDISSFIEFQKSKKFFGFFNKIFFFQSQINNIVIKMAEFETKLIEINDSIDEKYDHIFRNNSLNILKHMCDSEIKNRYHYPVQRINSLLETFSNQQTNNLTNFVVLISSIIGGIIGSIITYFIK